MSKKSLFWGLFFIFGAGLIIARGLGYLAGITLMNLVITYFMVSIIISSIYQVNFFGIFFPIAVLGIIFGTELGITEFIPVPILAVAFLLSVGLSIIFGKHNKCCRKFEKHNRNKCNPINCDTVIDVDDEDAFNFGVSFGSSAKYVNSKNFKQANLTCSFGELKLYLDKAEVSKDGATINVDVSFGAVQIYVPREWKTMVGVNAVLAGVDEKPRRYGGEESKALVKITGSATFSGVEIIYI